MPALLVMAGLKEKRESRLVFASVQNCALAHSSLSVCVGSSSGPMPHTLPYAVNYISKAHEMPRVHVIPLQRLRRSTDINVGRLLHALKKYCRCAPCSAGRNAVLFLKRRTKLNTRMTRHTALLRSSVLPSSRLPLQTPRVSRKADVAPYAIPERNRRVKK